jgi:hypothetical protein
MVVSRIALSLALLVLLGCAGKPKPKPEYVRGDGGTVDSETSRDSFACRREVAAMYGGTVAIGLIPMIQLSDARNTAYRECMESKGYKRNDE